MYSKECCSILNIFDGAQYLCPTISCFPYAWPPISSAGVGPPGPKDALAPSNAPDFLDRHLGGDAAL